MPNRICVSLALSLTLLTAAPASAWGPHTRITAAALEVLPQRDRLKAYLGDDFDRLARDYCWMGDWQEAVRPDHYADDFLLFPGSPRHVSHMHPHVRETFTPFFKRALQAVRTESPANVARWVGSLLHFVQDAGSPPHTTGVGGELHGKMERWVDESRLTIAGYAPQLLGRTDAAALAGFQERMAGLFDYSKARALRLRPLVEKLDRRADQPLELECALEVARVTADVVHTLFTLGLAEPATAGATLEGTLAYRPPAGYASVPAKVMLAGTDFSTTTDRDGRYHFRQLPPGRQAVWFLAPGLTAERIDGVELRAGERTVLSPNLRPDAVPGNLVRNPDFRVKWVADRPDAWTPDPVRRGRWASAPIRVPVGQACAVRVDGIAGQTAPASLRWRSNPSSTAGSVEAPLAAAVTPPGLTPFEKGFLYLEVLLHTDRPPQEVCRHVAVTFANR